MLRAATPTPRPTATPRPIPSRAAAGAALPPTTSRQATAAVEVVSWVTEEEGAREEIDEPERSWSEGRREEKEEPKRSLSGVDGRM